MTALVGIVCDGGCGRRRDMLTYNQVSATWIREKAKEAGWHKTRGDGYARDICPTCWAEGKR